MESTLNRLKLIRDQINCIAEVVKKPPYRVLVTGAAGQIGYIICFMIAQGKMLGDQNNVILHLFDIPQMESALRGVAMELSDGAFKNLSGIVYTADPTVAFKNVDIAVFCGARPRGPGMERKDLLSANAKIFEEQGSYLNKYAKKNVKSLVVGNPANTNCLILMKNAPSIDKKNFTAMTRLDLNRSISLVSDKVSIDKSKIKNIVIWGNHSSTQFPDLEYAVAEGVNNNYTFPLKSIINDEKWVKSDFITAVQQRVI